MERHVAAQGDVDEDLTSDNQGIVGDGLKLASIYVVVVFLIHEIQL